WNMDKLGYGAPMNEYLGVFWWNERVLSGGSLSTARVGFTGTFTGDEEILLTLNGAALGKTTFPADTNDIIANHFAAYINGVFVGTGEPARWFCGAFPRHGSHGCIHRDGIRVALVESLCYWVVEDAGIPEGGVSEYCAAAGRRGTNSECAVRRVPMVVFRGAW